MKRLAGVALAAMLSLSLAFFGTSTLSAQDEKKPGKKPSPEKKDQGEDKKDKDKKGKDGEKTEPKSDEDKAPEPTDEKQAKQFKRIRDDIERKFRKSTRAMVYVYATSEKTLERIEPTEEAAPTPPPTKGRGGVRPGGAIGGPSGQWELVVKNNAYKTTERDEGIEKVYKFLVEFPPPAPGSRKKKTKVDDEPPPPERSLLVVQAFPSTKDGEVRAEAYLEQLEDRFRKEKQAVEWKKAQKKKAK